MNWQRARTDENKNERKEAIYAAAFSLFKKKGYDNTSFNGIAAEAGFTKSNMYRYFSSKEDIFLNVFGELFEAWFEDYNQRLKSLPQSADFTHFAKAWTESFLSHLQFLDLVPILFVSLEKNSSFEQLVVFKRLSSALLYQLTLEINRIYPEVQGDNAFKFLNLSYAATSNYWAASTENEALIKIYQMEEFKPLKTDFENDLLQGVQIIIQGLHARNINKES